MHHSPEGMVAFFACITAMGIALTLLDVGPEGRRPLLGIAMTVVVGAMCAFMRDQIEATKMAWWLAGAAVLTGAVIVLGRRRA